MVTRARYAHKVPAEVSLAKAALTEPLAVVVKALRRLESASSGSGTRKCAVIGAGTIGHLAARVLSLRGHDVTVFDRDAARLALFGDAVATSQSLVGLDRFDWLVEATGDQKALTQMLHNSATGVTLLLTGFPYAQHNFSFESIVGFDRAVIGSVGSSSADFDAALALLPALDTTPFLASTYALQDYDKAWSAVRSRAHLKVMLKVDGSVT
jgi:threonine dehydrogenase-like Zn-dependent dehydrogenase